VLWALGHLDPLLPPALGVWHLEPLGDDFWFQFMIYQAAVLASALVIGFVLAQCTRVLGHDTIRALLPESRAQLFGLLTTAILCVAVIGVQWSAYRQNEVALAIWYVLNGAANGLFTVVWLILGARAAASVRQFWTALTLFGAAVASFFVALGGLALLLFLLRDSNPAPSLALTAVLIILFMGLIVVPSVLEMTAAAALWSGILTLSGWTGGLFDKKGGESRKE
jgi:hypothetical protein